MSADAYVLSAPLLVPALQGGAWPGPAHVPAGGGDDGGLSPSGAASAYLAPQLQP